MNRHLHALAILTAWSLSAGCTPHAANPVAPYTPPPPRTVLPPPTPEQTIARLTEHIDPDVEPHKAVSDTAFPEAIPTLEPGAKAPGVDAAPQDSEAPPNWALTIDSETASASMKDWTGLVLIPIVTTPSKAHSIKVSFVRIEAHPLKDGRIRVWTRIENESDENQIIEVGCSFKTAEVPEPNSTTFYPVDIPRSSSKDVFFLSPAEKNINAYTLLARQAKGN